MISLISTSFIIIKLKIGTNQRSSKTTKSLIARHSWIQSKYYSRKLIPPNSFGGFSLEIYFKNVSRKRKERNFAWYLATQ